MDSFTDLSSYITDAPVSKRCQDIDEDVLRDEETNAGTNNDLKGSCVIA
jgi:hypothetical protein